MERKKKIASRIYGFKKYFRLLMKGVAFASILFTLSIFILIILGGGEATIVFRPSQGEIFLEACLAFLGLIYVTFEIKNLTRIL